MLEKILEKRVVEKCWRRVLRGEVLLSSVGEEGCRDVW